MPTSWQIAPDAVFVHYATFHIPPEPNAFYCCNALQLLAYEMNYELLNQRHGAPLRLRFENQLSFTVAKRIRTIEFAADIQSIDAGERGCAWSVKNLRLTRRKERLETLAFVPLR